MTRDRERHSLVGDQWEDDPRSRCLARLDALHATLDRAFDDLLSIPSPRERGCVRDASFAGKSETPDGVVG